MEPVHLSNDSCQLYIVTLLFLSELLFHTICFLKIFFEDFSFLDYPQGFSLPFFKASAVQH
jgi:hypothetical protein